MDGKTEGSAMSKGRPADSRLLHCVVVVAAFAAP